MVGNALGFGYLGLGAENHGAEAELGHPEAAAAENAHFHLSHCEPLGFVGMSPLWSYTARLIRKR